MPDSDTDIDTALDAVPAVSSVSSVSSAAPMTSAFDVAAARAHFPSLALEQDGRPVVFADNPGGTQVTRECMEAITAYLTTSNANIGSAFLTSHRTDAMLADAHTATADLLGAADPREIVFGPNMTTLTFAFSRAIGRTLQSGDEIVVTALDHDANVAPWLALQEERGVVVRMADVEGISYLRTLRPATTVLYDADEEFEIGGSRTVREGDDIAIVGAGITVHEALKAADTLAQDGIEARVIDLYSIKPLDAETLRSVTCPIVTAEDHWAEGGIGEAVLSALGDADERPPVVRLAVHEMPHSGKPAELLAEAGIDADGIAAAARSLARAHAGAS